MSDLTKKWWETSDLKQNAWNLWSDSSGAQLAPGLKSLRLPRAQIPPNKGVARVGSGAKAPPLAARPTKRSANARCDRK